MYLIEILHQTTTVVIVIQIGSKLYLIEILHQTTTSSRQLSRQSRLYLIEILHQTTTDRYINPPVECCILSKFYIKPQHEVRYETVRGVVSYRNSTSNHNLHASITSSAALYLIEILHQTTTTRAVSGDFSKLYLIEILHQTTTPDE